MFCACFFFTRIPSYLVLSASFLFKIKFPNSDPCFPNFFFTKCFWKKIPLKFLLSSHADHYFYEMERRWLRSTKKSKMSSFSLIWKKKFPVLEDVKTNKAETRTRTWNWKWYQCKGENEVNCLDCLPSHSNPLLVPLSPEINKMPASYEQSA